MSWPYRFILTLPDADLERRRKILDSKGVYAQISALGFLGLLILFRSKGGKQSQFLQSGRANSAKSWWNTPAVRGGSETRKQYVVVLLWLFWLVCLSVWNTGDDYLHLTRALGHVGLSQLPFLVLLAPSSFFFSSNPTPTLPSIVSFASAIPQPVLTVYHRLLARLVLIPLLCSHAALFLLFYVQVPHPMFGTVFAKRIRDSDVQYGLAATSIALLVPILGRANVWKLRRLMMSGGSGGGALNNAESRRQLFYVVHLSLVGTFYGLAYCHVRYARPFVLEAMAAAIANVLCCRLLVSRNRA